MAHSAASFLRSVCVRVLPGCGVHTRWKRTSAAFVGSSPRSFQISTFAADVLWPEENKHCRKHALNARSPPHTKAHTRSNRPLPPDPAPDPRPPSDSSTTTNTRRRSKNTTCTRWWHSPRRAWSPLQLCQRWLARPSHALCQGDEPPGLTI